MRNLLFLLVVCFCGCICCTAQEIIKKPVANNQDLLEIYGKDYEIRTSAIVDKSPARNGIAIYKASKNSVLSNEDVEVFLEVDDTYSPHAPIAYPLYWYRIMMRNKTDDLIYVDKEKSFRIPSMGKIHCYYDEDDFDSDTHQLDKFVVIPPHTTIQLVKNNFCKKDKMHYLENSENYTLSLIPFIRSKYGAEITYEGQRLYTHPVSETFRFPYKGVNCGDVTYYDEENSPFAVTYVIRYSDARMSVSYSNLRFTFYISQIVPVSSKGKEYTSFPEWKKLVALSTDMWCSNSKERAPYKYLKGYTERTLISPIGYHTAKGIKGDVNEQLNEADLAFENGDYKKACIKYGDVIQYDELTSGRQAIKAGYSAYSLGNYSKAHEFFKKCYEYRDLDEEIFESLQGVLSELEQVVLYNGQATTKTTELVSSLIQKMNSIPCKEISTIEQTQRIKNPSIIRYHKSAKEMPKSDTEDSPAPTIQRDPLDADNVI